MKKLNKCIFLVGSNGSGKSTFLKKKLSKYKSFIFVSCSNDTTILNNEIEIIYFCFENESFIFKNKKGDEIKQFSNKTVIFFEPASIAEVGSYTLFSNLCKKLCFVKNNVIVFDDLRAVINEKTSNALKSLFVSYRQNNLHLYTVYHSLNDIHRSLIMHGSYIVLFLTKDKHLKEQVFFLKKAQKEVNKLCKEKPFSYKIYKL